MHLPNQLYIRFIHKHNWKIPVIRTSINFENIFYLRYKAGILIRWYFSVFAQVRLKFVLLLLTLLCTVVSCRPPLFVEDDYIMIFI